MLSSSRCVDWVGKDCAVVHVPGGEAIPRASRRDIGSWRGRLPPVQTFIPVVVPSRPSTVSCSGEEARSSTSLDPMLTFSVLVHESWGVHTRATIFRARQVPTRKERAERWDLYHPCAGILHLGPYGELLAHIAHNCQHSFISAYRLTSSRQ